MSERKAHKWAEVIKAWADGAEVQFRCLTSPDPADHQWRDNNFPSWGASSFEFRIKPEPPPLRVEGLPMGFPVKLKNGNEFIPHWIESGHWVVGAIRKGDKLDGLCTVIGDIDATSIIPTREVWLHIGDNGELNGIHYLDYTAQIRAGNQGGFIYGPIRIPLRPLPA